MGAIGGKDLGFEIKSIKDGAVLVQVARFYCTKCENTHEVPIRRGGIMNPEMLAKKARKVGWMANSHRMSRTFCPACLAGGEANDPMSEMKEIEAMPQAEPVEQPDIEMGHVNGTRPRLTLKAPPKVEAAPGGAYGDKRFQIRQLLEEHFDDKAGCYLGNFSDARVAELVGVPRAAVETLREAAFGPILADPELTALRAEVPALRQGIEDALRLAENLRIEADRLRTKLSAFSSRLEAKISGVPIPKTGE